MQFLPRMKSVVGAILSLVLVSGLTATAEESACVKSFRQADTEYLEMRVDLENRRFNAYGGTAVGALGGVACMYVRRTPAGLVGCSAIGVLVGGTGFTLGQLTDSKLDTLYDAHRLYAVYMAAKMGASGESEEAQAFASDLGVDIQRETLAFQELVTVMEWGKLCEGEKPLSYGEALELIQTRLTTQQR